MPRHAAPLDCSAEVRAELTAMSRSRKEESRMVERACIVLACVEGKEIQQVARETGASIPTVSKWRKRFAQAGLAGLRDQPRSGKPPTYDAGFRDRVLALLEQTPPAGLGHWDGREVARELGASVHAVWRLLRREGIYLQRLRTWCVSTDPEFAPKAAEVVGLYLNPPLNALVLSVDEKPSIQAIQRPSGYVETDSGAVVRAMKSTYKRNGTLNLLAALEIATGQIHAQTTEQKKREDFRRFLDGVVAELPSDKEIHVILDNYSTHKRNDDWLAKYDGRIQFHFTPTSASWLNQIEIYFSIVQRKVLTPNDFKSLSELEQRLLAFQQRYQETASPFQWTFTRKDLATLLAKIENKRFAPAA